MRSLGAQATLLPVAPIAKSCQLASVNISFCVSYSAGDSSDAVKSRNRARLGG